MDYLRVCAIDAGTRNFAVCVVDNMNWRQPLVWRKEDLWKPKPGRRSVPTKDEMIAITHEWCKDNYIMLCECDVIVLESQMRVPFIIMNAVINALHFNKTVQVHPMTVGSFYKLPKTRVLKKAAGLDFVRRFATVPFDNVKGDDLADAWLMAIYALIDKKAISAKELQ